MRYEENDSRIHHTEPTASGETLRRLKLASEYGSYENYSEKYALLRAYRDIDNDYKALIRKQRRNTLTCL